MCIYLKWNHLNQVTNFVNKPIRFRLVVYLLDTPFLFPMEVILQITLFNTRVLFPVYTSLHNVVNIYLVYIT